MDWLLGLGAIFVFGSFAFWAAVLILFVAIIAFDEHDRPFLSIFCALAFAFVMNAAGLIDIKSWTLMTGVTMLLVYLAAGVGWSFIKWFSYVMRRREKLQDMRAMFVKRLPDSKRQNISEELDQPLPHELRPDFRQFLYNGGYWSLEDRDSLESIETAPLIPQAGNYKGRIIRWMTLWPWSAFWTLLNDPIRRLFKYLYRKLSKSYERVTQRIYKNVSNDM